MNLRIDNACEITKDFCINCDSHFRVVRPLIMNVVISKRFMRDLKDTDKVKSIIRKIMDCNHLDFTELHKFEERVDGLLIFRAREGNLHIVYGVDKEKRIIFMRAIRNFKEYKKFLLNRIEINATIKNLTHA